MFSRDLILTAGWIISILWKEAWKKLARIKFLGGYCKIKL